MQRYQGRPVLTWWHGRPDNGGGESGYSIYDASYRLVTHVQPANGMLGDIHEFQITPRGTALMTISRQVRVKGRRVLEGGIQELDIKTGRVLFEWHSIDHVRLVESYYRLPRDPGRIFDYFHINSIEIDHDGNLLVSARNTHTIYKISRRTGRILWRLGGKRSDFTLGPGARFAWQHDARRQPNGALTLFDNSAGPQVRKQSRGLVLHLDMKRMKATLVRSFVHRPPIVAVDQGNMQRLSRGHYFVGWGHQPYFTEFGPRGTILFDGRFGRGRVDSYRAYRLPWIGRPARPPVVGVRGPKRLRQLERCDRGRGLAATRGPWQNRSAPGTDRGERKLRDPDPAPNRHRLDRGAWARPKAAVAWSLCSHASRLSCLCSRA